MKILILSHAKVADWYAGTLLMRGHEVSFCGGAIHGPGMKALADCDGCLLLGTSPDQFEIADFFESTGRKVWRQLADIPKTTS
jgi:hypothetical protein